MSNIFLFTGEEQYLLHAELRKWKQAFVEKFSEQGLFHFRTDNLDLSQIQSALLGGGMFATKSLVIINGVPKDTIATNKVKASDANPVEEFLLKQAERISPEVTLVLISYKPDKRTKTYKQLSKTAQIKEFKPLSGTELTQFVNKQLGSLTDNDLSNYIIEIVGTNLFNLHNECDKLSNYCEFNQHPKLTKSIITDVVYQQSETNSFIILDNIFTNPNKTVKLIDHIQQEQQDIFQFLGMMYWGLKLVLQMHDLYNQGITSSKALASQLKAHPFAVSKQLKNIATINKHQSKISELYQGLLRLDSSIKTGKLPQEVFWLEMKSMVLQLNS